MNCFDETMGRILSWLCLSGMAVSLVSLVACFVVRGFADLRRRVHRVPFLHLVLLSFAVGYMTEIGATKTNQQNNLIQPMMTMPRIAGLQAMANPLNALGEGALNETVSEDDISRGYYLEAVITNDFPCVAPTNMALVGNWHRRGTLNEWIRLEFGGFEFPYGTNAATRLANCSVFSDGKIRPTPRDIAQEIAAVGSPMLAIEGISSFGVAETDGSGRLLCWNNFFGWDAAAAMTTGVVNAQIELKPSGDFTTRSNNVEKIYRRIYPFDWDGDGLANEIDPAPRHYDGEYFGPRQELPENANTNAYCRIDIVSPFENSEIIFTGNGESDLPDPRFVARGGDTNRVTLLIGKEYSVSSSVDFTVVGMSDERIEVEGVRSSSAIRKRVRFPVAVECEPGEGKAFLVAVQPWWLGGGIDWATNVCCGIAGSGTNFQYSCGWGCSCGGCAAEGAYRYEGYSLPFAATPCQCVSPTATGLGLSLEFTKSAIIFEDAYTNSPNEVVGLASTTNRLVCTISGGQYGGQFMVSLSDGGRLTRVGGTLFPCSGAVAAGETVEVWADYTAHLPSAAEGDIAATATLTGYFSGETATAAATTTAVKLTVEADATIPSNRVRHVFGPAETAVIRQTPSSPVLQMAKILPYGGFCGIQDGVFILNTPSRGSTFQIASYIEGVSSGHVFRFRVVEPTSLRGENPRPFSWSVWHSLYLQGLVEAPYTSLETNEAGVVIMLDVFVEPDFVNMEKIRFYEQYAPTSNRTGCYLDTDYFREEYLAHTYENGAISNLTNASHVGAGNKMMGFDRAGGFVGAMDHYESGSYDLNIPVRWFVDNADNDNPDTYHLTNVIQRIFLFTNGTMRVEKLGVSLERSIIN